MNNDPQTVERNTVRAVNLICYVVCNKDNNVTRRIQLKYDTHETESRLDICRIIQQGQ